MTAQLGAEFYDTDELDLELDDDISSDEFREWRGNRHLERRRRRDERRVARHSRRERLPPLNAEGRAVSSCLERCLQRIVPTIIRRLRTCNAEILRTQRPQRWSTPPTSGQPTSFRNLARRASAPSSFGRATNSMVPPGSTTSRSAMSPQDILNSESGRLRYAFNIDVTRTGANLQINEVISTFEQIQQYLNDNSTFIHRLPSNDPEIAGIGLGTEEMPDGGGRRISERRIFLGDAWFNAASSRYYFSLMPCDGPDGTTQDRAAVVQDGTLIHECVHLVHGPGHSDHGRRRNPYAYGVYVMASECGRHRLPQTPADLERATLANA